MVYGTSAVTSVPYGLNIAASNKLYVPVPPSQVVYSQFEHVSGYAEDNGTQGVSITKAYLLNSIIDGLSAAKQNTQTKAQTVGLDNGQLDALIQNYQKQLQTALTQAAPFASLPRAGSVFSISV